jgi:hypothetical protein
MGRQREPHKLNNSSKSQKENIRSLDTGIRATVLTNNTQAWK